MRVMHFLSSIFFRKSCYYYSPNVFKRLYSLDNGINVERIGRVTAFVINNPDSKNEIDENMFYQLCEEMQKFEADDTAAVGVIYGVGGNFCTGCKENFVPDIKKLIIHRQKPLVAGLTGYTTRFGFELALLADLRVMEDTAQMGLNAYPMELSSMIYHRLVAIAGLSTALDLALTGRNISWKEAHQCGLSNRLVDCGTAIGQAVNLAKNIGKFPIPSLRSVKSAVYSTSPHCL